MTTISLGRVLAAVDTTLHTRLLQKISTGKVGVVLANGAGSEVLAFGPGAPYASQVAAEQECKANGWTIVGVMPAGTQEAGFSTTKVAYTLLLLATRQARDWRTAAELAGAHRDNVTATMREAGLLK